MVDHLYYEAAVFFSLPYFDPDLINALAKSRENGLFSPHSPIRVNSSRVENTCIITDQPIHPRFQLA
jgi:hypothetical protein